jgi:hypothetical protein
MKLRHAAAISLVGWYLMIPPFPEVSNHKTMPHSRAGASAAVTIRQLNANGLRQRRKNITQQNFSDLNDNSKTRGTGYF